MRTAWEKITLIAVLVTTWQAFEKAGVIPVVDVEWYWYTWLVLWVMAGNDYTQRVKQ
jgi:hypothetical protein